MHASFTMYICVEFFILYFCIMNMHVYAYFDMGHLAAQASTDSES